MEKLINKKIIEIVHKVNAMIPVVWDDCYINFEVDETSSGGVIFFFRYKGEYIYFMDIPKLFSVPGDNFDLDFIELFDLGVEVKKLFNENNLPKWTQFTIKIDEDNKLSVDFDYAPWLKSEFGPTDRTNFFRYKYLGFKPRSDKEQAMFDDMEAFQKQYNTK